jgi:hypothetical protein
LLKAIFKISLVENRGDYLEIARQKYFFNDPSAPSFRLLEDEDDNDKQIEEPELYRPLGMDDCTYNKQIEVTRQPIYSSGGHSFLSCIFY